MMQLRIRFLIPVILALQADWWLPWSPVGAHRNEEGGRVWTSWTDWSECTKTCGKGTAIRTRKCIVELSNKPRNNDTFCLGEDVEFTFCVESSCQDGVMNYTAGSGGWTSWTKWSKCTKTCGRGTAIRKRNCTVAAPRNNDTLCLGPDVELTFCEQPSCQDTGDVDLEEESPGLTGLTGYQKTGKSYEILACVVLLSLLVSTVTILGIMYYLKKRVKKSIAVSGSNKYADTHGVKECYFRDQNTQIRCLDSTAIFGSSMESCLNLPANTAMAVELETCTCTNALWKSNKECPFRFQTTPMPRLENPGNLSAPVDSLVPRFQQQVDLADKTATIGESETCSRANNAWARECSSTYQPLPIIYLDSDPSIFNSSMESLDTSCRQQRVDLPDKTATAAAVESETWFCANASWESDKESSSTDLSIPMGFSDSGLASCQSLVNSTAFPWATFPPEVNERFVSCARVDHTGGLLTIFGTIISLFVPPLAFSKGRAETLYISLLKDQSKGSPALDNGEALVSPVVVCGPNGTKFDKPVTISIPHSALMEEGSWNLRAKWDDSDAEMPSEWKDMAPTFPDDMQFSQNMCQIQVDHFTRFVFVGASKNGRKRVKIVTYALFCDNVEDCWINVYCVDDTEAPLKLVDQQELARGGRRVDVPKLMLFEDGGKDLTIRLEEQQSDWEVVAGDNCQTIPFEQIWKQAPDGTPKCTFQLKRTGQTEQQLRCQIKAQQCPREFEQEVLVSVELAQVGQVGCETFELSSPWSIASAPENSLLDQQPVNNEQMCAEAACEQKTVNIVAYMRTSGSAGDCYIHIYCVDNIEELVDQGRRIDTPKLFTLENNNEDLKISLENQPNGWKEFPDRDVQSSCKIIPFDHIKKQAPGSNPCCTYLFRRTDQNERQLRCHFKLYQRPGKFEQEILVSEELTNFTQVEGEATGKENGNMTPVSSSSGYSSLPEVSYTIPFPLRRKLMILLDPERDSDWRLFAEKMGVDSQYIDYMIYSLERRLRESATEHLLTVKWEEQNRPLSDLPDLLKAIGRFDALEATKDYLETRETRL